MSRPFPPVEPPLLDEQDGRTYPRLVALIGRLLAPDGCPWDRAQSFATLRRHLLEEAGEVASAIDDGDCEAIREELGDLLMHVALLSEFGRRERAFGPDDVVVGIVEKLVRRHPHVFGSDSVDGPGQVLRSWERIKAEERRGKDKPGGMLSGIPNHMPSLSRAHRASEKAARVGFDWDSALGPRAKVTEELAELDAAIAAADAATPAGRRQVEDELGDVMFSLVNLARHLEIDPEAALSKTVSKFTRRFAAVEDMVEREHGGWPQTEPLSIEVLEQYWQRAKERDGTR